MGTLNIHVTLGFVLTNYVYWPHGVYQTLNIINKILSSFFIAKFVYSLLYPSKCIGVTKRLYKRHKTKKLSVYLCVSGDHPQQVKERLKVWAQDVACTVHLCNRYPKTKAKTLSEDWSVRAYVIYRQKQKLYLRIDLWELMSYISSSIGSFFDKIIFIEFHSPHFPLFHLWKIFRVAHVISLNLNKQCSFIFFFICL